MVNDRNLNRDKTNQSKANLHELISPYQPSCSLRSSNQLLLTVLRASLTNGQHAFSYSCLFIWNTISLSDRDAPSINIDLHSSAAKNHFTFVPSSPDLCHLVTARASVSSYAELCRALQIYVCIYVNMTQSRLTIAETVKSRLCIFSVNHSTLRRVLQKMTAWVMVSVSYRSHSVSSFHSCHRPRQHNSHTTLALITELEKIMIFLNIKNQLNQIFLYFFKISISVPTFHQMFETAGLSAQSHKQHGRHASAISSYTLAKQKVSKQLLIKVSLLWLTRSSATA